MLERKDKTGRIKGNPKSTEEFFREAKAIHGDKYDYSNFIYVNNKTKGEIKCNQCGNTFEMIPTNHLSKKQGCPFCNGTRKYTTEEWVQKAKEKFDYDYSESKYVDAKTKIKIICHEKDEFGEEHGPFWKQPRKHLYGQGCPKCSLMSSIPFNLFVKRAKKTHGNKYAYHEDKYNSFYRDTTITCPIHGDFAQLASLHASGCGCQKCADEKRVNASKLPFDEFVQRAIKIHGDKYEYHIDDYSAYSNKTRITCPMHGDFWQTPSKHAMGQKCPICAKEEQGERQRLSKDVFIERAKAIHGDKYDYSRVIYKGNDENVTIICRKHGAFLQKPVKHWTGQGCPICNASHLEMEVQKLLTENNIQHVYQATKKDLPFLNMLRLDFYIPELNLAIECQGIQHFEDIKFFGGEKVLERDKIKWQLCQENHVKLIYYANIETIPKESDFYADKTVMYNKTDLLNYLKAHETTY